MALTKSHLLRQLRLRRRERQHPKEATTAKTAIKVNNSQKCCCRHGIVGHWRTTLRVKGRRTVFPKVNFSSRKAHAHSVQEDVEHKSTAPKTTTTTTATTRPVATVVCGPEDVPIFHAGSGSQANALRASPGYQSFYNACLQVWLDSTTRGNHGGTSNDAVVVVNRHTVVSLIQAKMGTQRRFLKQIRHNGGTTPATANHNDTTSTSSSNLTKTGGAMEWTLITDQVQLARICLSRISNMRQRELTGSMPLPKPLSCTQTRRQNDSPMDQSVIPTAAAASRMALPMAPPPRRRKPGRPKKNRPTIDSNNNVDLVPTKKDSFKHEEHEDNLSQVDKENENAPPVCAATPSPRHTNTKTCSVTNKTNLLQRHWYQVNIWKPASDDNKNQSGNSSALNLQIVAAVNVCLPCHCDLAWCRGLMEDQRVFPLPSASSADRGGAGGEGSSWKFVFWDFKSDDTGTRATTIGTRTTTILEPTVEQFYTLSGYLKMAKTTTTTTNNNNNRSSRELPQGIIHIMIAQDDSSRKELFIK
ncbi:hypothetical protein ACA910_000214 [Epithemia clementina (nom. ined.)]